LDNYDPGRDDLTFDVVEFKLRIRLCKDPDTEEEGK